MRPVAEGGVADEDGEFENSGLGHSATGLRKEVTQMPTCGECKLLVQNKAGVYVCIAKLSQCLSDQLTPQTDAKMCIKFDKKEQK